ncbi:hypothetical protein BKP42_66700 [Rhodococcus erythropolis]|nr:hypothetical protein BKP42_66700 [Rhodococcus erythropolis]
MCRRNCYTVRYVFQDRPAPCSSKMRTPPRDRAAPYTFNGQDGRIRYMEARLTRIARRTPGRLHLRTRTTIECSCRPMERQLLQLHVRALTSELDSQCGKHSEDSSMDAKARSSTEQTNPAQPPESFARDSVVHRGVDRMRSCISHLPATPREALAAPDTGASFDARSVQARSTRSRTKSLTNILVSTFCWPYHESRTGNVGI